MKTEYKVVKSKILSLRLNADKAKPFRQDGQNGLWKPSDKVEHTELNVRKQMHISMFQSF